MDVECEWMFEAGASEVRKQKHGVVLPVNNYDKVLVHKHIAVYLVPDLSGQIDDGATLVVLDVLHILLHNRVASLNENVDELPFLGQAADVKTVDADLLGKLRDGEASQIWVFKAL